MQRRTFLKTSAFAAGWGAASRLASPQVPAGTSPALFPENFAWGAATSAMQVEGYPYAGGGGRSIWSVLDKEPSLVKDGSNDLIADDSYHLYARDVAMLKSMGLNSYRFSMSWPRVLPNGTGQPSTQGLDYYDRLLDTVLQAGIEPWVTVYHFDYPEALEAKGGWLHPDSSHWLAEYAAVLAARYGDRVHHWMTINEPNITWAFGWEAAQSPPYKKLSREQLGTGAHNLLLGHGRAVAAIHAKARQTPQISLPIAGQVALPATDSPTDIAAARQASFSMAPHSLGPGIPALTTINMALWLDPIYLGHYSEETLAELPVLRQLGTPEALAVIHQPQHPVDFLAVNLYFASRVKAGPAGKPQAVPDPPDIPRSAYGWPVTPELLYWGPRLLHERYDRPIAITENGISLHDHPGPDGKVHDPERSAFLRGYLSHLLRAHRENIPLLGYFHWSLEDNWEFNQGFLQQFGLVYVDRKTLQRTPKDSASTYAEIVRTRGATLASLPRPVA